MIQSEHCSLHCRDAIFTVLRSDEGVGQGEQSQNFDVLATICADNVLCRCSETFDFDVLLAGRDTSHSWLRGKSASHAALL